MLRVQISKSKYGGLFVSMAAGAIVTKAMNQFIFSNERHDHELTTSGKLNYSPNKSRVN